MMKAEDLSDTIYHAVNSPNNCATVKKNYS